MLAETVYVAALAPVALPRRLPWALDSAQGVSATASPISLSWETSATPVAAVDTYP